jgi:phosphatidylinositol alpha-mannosyltransferase
VLLEAMAASTPVVASSIDGYLNVATNDVDSLLVPPGDSTELARAIAKVLADPRLAERLTAAGVERASHYSMDALADAYIEIYERALHMERTNVTTIEVPRFLKRFESRFLRKSHLA